MSSQLNERYYCELELLLEPLNRLRILIQEGRLNGSLKGPESSSLAILLAEAKDRLTDCAVEGERRLQHAFLLMIDEINSTLVQHRSLVLQVAKSRARKQGTRLGYALNQDINRGYISSNQSIQPLPCLEWTEFMQRVVSSSSE